MFTLEQELSCLVECQFLISILKNKILKINKMKISFKHISFFPIHLRNKSNAYFARVTQCDAR
jgi:hypothetical protein